MPGPYPNQVGQTVDVRAGPGKVSNAPCDSNVKLVLRTLSLYLWSAALTDLNSNQALVFLFSYVSLGSLLSQRLPFPSCNWR